MKKSSSPSTIFFLIKGPLSLLTPAGIVRLETGNMYRADPSDVKIKRMLEAGLLRKATPKEVIDGYIEYTKEVFNIKE